MARERMIYQTDETRQRILAKARQLFTQRGLYATQMQDVARELGISRTSLYRYYQDKSELATAILVQILQTLRNQWESVRLKSPPRRNALAELEFYIREFWLAENQDGRQVFIAEYDAYFSGARLTSAVQANLEGALHQLDIHLPSGIISEGINQGCIRPDIDPHLASVTIINAVRSLQQRLILRSRVLVELRKDEPSKMIDELIGYLIRGIACP